MGKLGISALVAALSAALAGCYAYRGGAVPHFNEEVVAEPPVHRVIVLTVKVDSTTGGDADVLKIATHDIESALQDAGGEAMPSGAVADPDGTLLVSLRLNGSVVGQALSGLLCGATLFLIPGYAGFDVIFDADMVTRDGTRRQYHYADTYKLWMELFLLPVNNSPDDVLAALIRDMARSLAHDLQKDGVLPHPVSASIGFKGAETPESNVGKT